MSARGCEVCGGRVRPLDDQSAFGYCENCGIMYALKDRLTKGSVPEAPNGLGAVIPSESRDRGGPLGSSVVHAETPAQIPGTRWRCPDCDTDIRSESESELEFLKREHIREYHPNRPTGQRLQSP